MWEATDRTPPSWTFEETIAVYAADVLTTVGNARVFVNEEVVTILPSNVNLPRVSVNALGFTATGVTGASYLTFAIPGDRRPFQGNDMGITTILQVGGDDAPLEVGLGLCLGNGDVRLYMPDGAETVVVYGFTFSYIGNTAIPP